MLGRVDFARRLTTTKNTAPSSMRLASGSFQTPGAYSNQKANTREKRMVVSFGAANAPSVIYHGLGFAPSGYTVLGISGAAQVYNDFPIHSTSRVIVLKCTAANAVADILVR